MRCLVRFFVSVQVEEATVVMEDDSPAEPAGTPGTLRNLSAWSITIPYIDSYEDEVKREKIPVFCIDVERNDRKEGESVKPEIFWKIFPSLKSCSFVLV